MANLKISELPDATLPINTGVKFEAVQNGQNVKVDADDMPGGGGTGVVETIVAGTGISVDDTDPANPIVTATGGGSGDVVGPASATADAPALFDGTTGKLIKNSTPTGTGNPVLATAPTLSNPVVGTQSANDNSTKGASTAYADAKVANDLSASTTVAPSKTAVNTALALKSDVLATIRGPLSASHTLDSTDLATVNAGGTLFVHMDVASANNLTVPANATVAFPVGTVLFVTQVGAGQTTIVAAGSVTIRNANGLILGSQYATAGLRKIATNEWIATGELKI